MPYLISFQTKLSAPGTVALKARIDEYSQPVTYIGSSERIRSIQLEKKHFLKEIAAMMQATRWPFPPYKFFRIKTNPPEYTEIKNLRLLSDSSSSDDGGGSDNGGGSDDSGGSDDGGGSNNDEDSEDSKDELVVD